MSEAMTAGRDLDARVHQWLNNHVPIDVRGLDPPHYSTEIGVAWGLVARLSELFDDVFVAHIKGQRYPWEVECSDKHDNPSPRQAIYECADTAPLAICRAALHAVGSR